MQEWNLGAWVLDSALSLIRHVTLGKSFASLVLVSRMQIERIRIIALQGLFHCNHLLVQGLEAFVTTKVTEATWPGHGEDSYVRWVA